MLFLFITEFHGKNYKRDRFDMSRREIKLCRVVPRALIDPVNHVYPVKLKGPMNFQERAITIQQVSQKLDIPKPTLRFWEREKG